jgi:hypothetical protein
MCDVLRVGPSAAITVSMAVENKNETESLTSYLSVQTKRGHVIERMWEEKKAALGASGLLAAPFWS